MPFTMERIGVVQTEAKELPHHCRLSDIEGYLIIDEKYRLGLTDIQLGDRIIVLFCFHESPVFTSKMLRLVPPHRDNELGVFNTCSPRRPNPIGMSVVEVLGINGSRIQVKGIDMRDGTPILDIKPFRAFAD